MRSLNWYLQISVFRSKTISPATSLGHSFEGGVRGRAPSFVEFSTGVRSWRAVLSWVAAGARRGARGWWAAPAPGTACAWSCSRELSACAPPAGAPDWEATGVTLLPASWKLTQIMLYPQLGICMQVFRQSMTLRNSTLFWDLIWDIFFFMTAYMTFNLSVPLLGYIVLILIILYILIQRTLCKE